jgi:(1->4)-alpha-D-glucan 1-alpha-D-glucosylmutase
MNDSVQPDASIERPCHTPLATYRLQFHRDFTFRDAERVVPYLHELGVTDCYCSPYVMARPGSLHGYDIIDHTRLNPELGTGQDYASFVAALHAHGLHQILDFVPNHMGIDPLANQWWREVLENGPSSVHGRFFDIDWEPVKDELQGKVLLPILGDQYGSVLERGELELGFAGGALFLDYYEHRLPINPRQAILVYRHEVDRLREELGEQDRNLREFLSILTELSNLPDYRETDPVKIAERHREKEVARERLARLAASSEPVRRHIENAVRVFNGRPGVPESFDLLHELLEAQAYRLAYWRTASHEINYRRFFDINDLAGIRMEDPEVFASTHVLVADLIGDGAVSGLRIDHPDGLYDPAEYFHRLQDLAGRACPEQAGRSPGARPLYLVAEKILSPDETLPPDWAVYGTTGYNFLNEMNGLFVDPGNARAMRRVYRRLTHQTETFEQVAYTCKKLITLTSLASELNVLAHALNRISEGNRRSRDFTLNSLREVLGEVVACFPVYRTYVNRSGWTQSDRRMIETAVRRARRSNQTLEASSWDFLREVLLPRKVEQAATGGVEPPVERRVSYPPPDPEQHRRRLDFSMRFQQYTAPVQAKGIEDTAFYRYNPLISLNEVGGDPGRFGRSAAEFHQTARYRLEHWPLEMLATSTHDAKLGEDTRARINALSELADDWRRTVARCMRINTSHRTRVDGEPAPDRNDEYRFYQVLLGTWPAEALGDIAAGQVLAAPDSAYVDRLRGYMLKAIKEAKVHTSWVNENFAYEQAVVRFVERTLEGPTAGRFREALLPLLGRVAHLGMIYSLSQVAIKLTSPGIPDIYQGTELWDLHLVDPDNRQPVDFERRAQMLADIRAWLPGDLAVAVPPDAVSSRTEAIRAMLGEWTDGRIKLFLVSAGLRLRSARPELFLSGDYVPLEGLVKNAGEVLTFARTLAGEAVIVVAPRLVAQVAGTTLPTGNAWRESRVLLPDNLAGQYRNLLTGDTVSTGADAGPPALRIADVLATVPVGLLYRI